ncbi:sensor histidine kinase [Streptomyces sp. NPDC058284]|uniref:sensor histidine kinase n=1 Tax=unclassified Streptomyces TaxID=2593676 RepID=UPI003647C0CE
MSVTPPMSLFRHAPPGVWAAASWCLGMAVAARAYSGLPLMPTSAFGGPSPVGWLVVVVATGTAVVAARLLGRRPLPALGLLIIASYAATLALNETGIAFLQYAAIDVALGFIAATRAPRSRRAALVLALCVLPGYALLRQLLGLPVQLPHSLDTSWSEWRTYSLMAVVGWLVGDSVRRARAYAERLSSQATTQAVTAERLRIAREMHDTVAHSIGIIALQAGAAARVVETRPAAAREAMTAVELAGRETLAGLRRMLGALRENESGEGPDGTRRPAPRGPAEGLADVERLAASTTAAGVRVDVTWRGERRPLPTDVDLSAYRIIQESLTNVVRHAATTACTVSVDHRDEEIIIEIEDRGRGRAKTAAASSTGTGTGTGPGTASGTGVGYGLVGMRERVALLHGEFSAAPRPGGGFRVRARLPLPAPAVAR